MNETRGVNSVLAKIYDREYVMRTDGDPEQLQTLCALLDERMQNVATATGTADTLKVAVLAALSIANDAYRAKEEAMKLDEAIEKRSVVCVSILEQSIS